MVEIFIQTPELSSTDGDNMKASDGEIRNLSELYTVILLTEPEYRGH